MVRVSILVIGLSGILNAENLLRSTEHASDDVLSAQFLCNEERELHKQIHYLSNEFTSFQQELSKVCQHVKDVDFKVRFLDLYSSFVTLHNEFVHLKMEVFSESGEKGSKECYQEESVRLCENLERLVQDLNELHEKYAQEVSAAQQRAYSQEINRLSEQLAASRSTAHVQRNKNRDFIFHAEHVLADLRTLVAEINSFDLPAQVKSDWLGLVALAASRLTSVLNANMDGKRVDDPKVVASEEMRKK